MSHSKSLIPFSTISLITQSRSAPWRLAKQFFNAGCTFGRPAVPAQFLPACASEAWASSFMFIWFGFGITGMSYRWWAPIVGSRGRDWSSSSGIGVGSGDGWRSGIGVKPENKRVVASGLRRKKQTESNASSSLFFLLGHSLYLLSEKSSVVASGKQRKKILYLENQGPEYGTGPTSGPPLSTEKSCPFIMLLSADRKGGGPIRPGQIFLSSHIVV